MKKKKCACCAKIKGKRSCKHVGGAVICAPCCLARQDESCGGCVHDPRFQGERPRGGKRTRTPVPGFIARIDPEVDELVEEILRQAENGFLDEARGRMLSLLRFHPDLHSVHFGLGTILALQGDHEGSIGYFESSLALFPTGVDAWHNLAVSYKEMLDMVNATRSFQKVVEYGQPGEELVVQAQDFISSMARVAHEVSGLSLETYLQLQDVFAAAFQDLRAGRYEEARIGFQKVLSTDPKHTQSWGNLGLCYGYLGDRQKAEEALERALELDPEYGPALSNRALLRSLKDGQAISGIATGEVEYYSDKVRNR